VKVGYFSPLPPARTGVADYAATLLAALKRFGEVELGPRNADVNLYQIGNNQLHREIYAKALAEPGVVVLHDAVLQHFFLGSLTEAQYIDEFVYNYGEWSRGMAAQLWIRRAASGAAVEYFRYPMLRRIAEVSRAIVVHNPAAAAMVRAHVPSANIIEIPHLFEMPGVSECSRARGQFVFGVFGHLRESKRVLTVLRAYRDVREQAGNIGLLIAGECVSSDLARAMTPLLDQPGITRVGYTEEGDFWRNAQSVDACVNLRYPAAGETSGIAIRLMGLGKPVILTSGTETSRFPETSCLRVDAGVAEQAMLAEFMLWLSRFPEHASAIGQRAAAHIREFHSVDAVAARYWQVLLKSAE
jgi:glycosyltransferase involved in cell wall biosynthesis